MKFDLTNFDKNSFKPPSKYLYAREVIDKLQDLSSLIDSQSTLLQNQEISEEERQTQIKELDQVLFNTMKNLVNVAYKNNTRTFLSQYKDVFNALSDKLEEAVKAKDTDRKFIILRVLAILCEGKIQGTDRVDDVKILQDLLDEEEDFETRIVISYLISELSKIRQTEQLEQLAFMAQAPNLLIKNKKSLIQIYQDKTPVENQTLDFEAYFGSHIDKGSKLVQIPYQQIIASKLSSRSLAIELASQYEREHNEEFLSQLQIKILWFRHLCKNFPIEKSMSLLFEATVCACGIINNNKSSEFKTYFKDNFFYEVLEIIKISFVRDLVFSATKMLNLVLFKLLGQIMNIGIFFNPKDIKGLFGESNSKAAVIYLIEDLASFKLIREGIPSESSLIDETDGVLIKPTSSTSLLNGLCISDEFTQIQASELIYHLVRVMISQQRGTQTFNDFMQQALPLLLSFLQDVPEDRIYNQNLLVSNYILQLLKPILRPRFEEANSIIAKIEERIVYEISNIDKDLYSWCNSKGAPKVVDHRERQRLVKNFINILADLSQRDQNAFGISNKILESKIIDSLLSLLAYNNDQQGELVDEILSRIPSLLGAICGDNPAIIPKLIRDQIVTRLIESLEQRTPVANEAIENSLYLLHQVTIHEEGRQYIENRSFFKVLLERAYDVKYGHILNSEQVAIRAYIPSIFDKIPQTKETAKIILKDVLSKIEEFAKEETIWFLHLHRDSSITLQERSKQISLRGSSCKGKGLIQLLNMIYCFALLSHDNFGHNRHTGDLLDQPNFKRFMNNCYMQIIKLPHLEEFHLQFEKIFKFLIENSSYPSNVQAFIDLLSQETVAISQISQTPLYELTDFDFSPAKLEDNLKPVDELSLEGLKEFASKGELTIFQLNKFMSLIKLVFQLQSQTLQQIIMHKSILQVAKIASYIRRIYNNQKASYFVLQKEKLQSQSNENEEMKDEAESSQIDTSTKPQADQQPHVPEASSLIEKEVREIQQLLDPKPDLIVKKDIKQLLFERAGHQKKHIFQKREDISMIKHYMYVDLNKQFQVEQLVKINDLALSEFIQKLLNKSLNPRDLVLEQKEAYDKIMKLIGKISYKKVKILKKSLLPDELINPDSTQLQKSLFEISLALFDFKTSVKSSQVDGICFYIFLKLGGMNILCDIFDWLSTKCLQKIGDDYPLLTVFLFDEACTHLKSVMGSLLYAKSNEHLLNCLLNFDLQNDFSDVKNLYQSFFTFVCKRLLKTQSDGDHKQGNLILNLNNPRQTSLQEVIIMLLRYASKSFSQCVILQQDLRSQRRDDGRRQRQQVQADNQLVDQLIAMIGCTRNRAQAALVQANNDINTAVNILLENQADSDNEAMGINPNRQLAQVDEEISSGHSDLENENMSQLEGPEFIMKRPKVPKVPKIQESDFQATLLETQQQGFKWMIELFEELQTKATSDWKSQHKYSPGTLSDFREFIISLILHERSHEKLQQYYAEIDRLFKQSIGDFKELLRQLGEPERQNIQFENFGGQKELSSESDDFVMRESSQDDDSSNLTKNANVLDKNENSSRLNQAREDKIENLSCVAEWLLVDLAIISRLISNNKICFKEAVVTSSVFFKISELQEEIFKSLSKTNISNTQLGLRNMDIIQKVILEITQLQFVIVQIAQLDIIRYSSPKYRGPDAKLKMEKLCSKINTSSCLAFHLQILFSHFSPSEIGNSFKLKDSVTFCSAILSLKIVMGTSLLSGLTPEEQQQKAFQIFCLIQKFEGKKAITKNAQNQLILMLLEDQKMIMNQFEKLSTKLLYIKYEVETYKKDGNKPKSSAASEKTEKEKQEEKEAYLKSKSNYKNFLKYTQELQKKNDKQFEQVLKENFIIQTVKVANNLSQDKATICLKDTKFADVKKQMSKERTQLKQLMKTLDSKNDKSVKALVSQSKKSQVASINESFVLAINSIISRAAELTQKKLEQFNEFNKQKAQNLKLLVEPSQTFQDIKSQKVVLGDIGYISVAYPAVTALLLQTHPQQKRSYANWYIKDFLVSLILNRSEKITLVPKAKDESQMEVSGQSQDNQTVKMKEITFSEGLSKSIKELEDLYAEVNNLTGYNHLMTIQDIAVKHQLRFKFMTESLFILQRAMRDKSINPQLQKLQIFVALSVIECLIDTSSPRLKGHVIAQDNFVNSVRLAVYRDASLKESRLPPNLIKLIDEMLGDGTPQNPGPIDVTLEQNKEIIQLTVNILNILAEFVVKEQKKEENRGKGSDARALASSLSTEERKREIVPQNRQRRRQQRRSIDEALSDDSRNEYIYALRNNRIMDEDEEEDEERKQIGDEDDDDQSLGDGQPLPQPRLPESDEDDEMEEDEDLGEDDDNDDDDDDNDEDMDDDDPAGYERYLANSNEDGGIDWPLNPDEMMFDQDEDDDDLMDQDDDDDDDMDMVGQNERWIHANDPRNRQGAEGGQDIINPRINHENDGWMIPGQVGQGNERENFSQHWSREEAEVQRVLSFLRSTSRVEGRVGMGPFGAYVGNQVQDPFMRDIGGAWQPFTSIIDQMYQNLRPESESQFLEMIQSQRVQFDNESSQAAVERVHERLMQEESKNRIDNIVANIQPPQLIRNMMIPPAFRPMGQDDHAEIMVEIDGHRIQQDDLLNRINLDMDGIFQVRGGFGVGGAMGQGLFGGGLAGFADPNLDPLFMRPFGRPEANDPYGGRRGIPRIFGRQHNGGLDFDGHGSQNLMLSNLQRYQQAAVNESVEDLGHRLLQSMEVQVEEAKEAPSQTALNTSSTNPFSMPSQLNQRRGNAMEASEEISNEALLSNFFIESSLGGRGARPAAAQSQDRRENRSSSVQRVQAPVQVPGSMGLQIQENIQPIQPVLPSLQPIQPVLPSLSPYQNLNERQRLHEQSLAMQEAIARQSREIQQIMEMVHQEMPVREILHHVAEMQPPDQQPADIAPVQQQIQSISIYDNTIPNIQQQMPQQIVSNEASSQDQLMQVQRQIEEQETLINNENLFQRIASEYEQSQQPSLAQVDQVMEEVQERSAFDDERSQAPAQQQINYYDPPTELRQVQELVNQSQAVIVEEVKSQQQEENKAEEQNQDGSAIIFGYPIHVLEAYGLDLETLQSIPEELAEEFIADYGIPSEYRQRPAAQVQQQQQVQPPSDQQQQPEAQQNINEEQKASEEVQQPAAQSQANSVADQNAALAIQLGIDPEFIANLPPEMVMDLINDEQFRQRNLGQVVQPSAPQRQAEEMDFASFIATVIDPSLRREVFANMNEQQVAALPPNLMAEARRVHDHIRAERQRREQRDPGDIHDRAQAMLDQMNRLRAMDPDQFGIPPQRGRGRGRPGDFERRYGGGQDRGAREGRDQLQATQDGLEYAVNKWHQLMLDETTQAFIEDLLPTLANQLSADEKIIEQLLLVLMTSQSIECSLLPCLMNLIKILAVGQPIIRNKVLSVITFLMKAFARHEDEALQAIYADQQHKINKRRAALLLIGCLRLLLNSNKSLMKWMLKGLFQKEESKQQQQLQGPLGSNQSSSNQFQQKQNLMLKKQYKYLLSKQQNEASQQTASPMQMEISTPQKLEDRQPSAQSEIVTAQSNLEGEQINTSTTLVQPSLSVNVSMIKPNPVLVLKPIPALAEIFSLIQSPLFKNDKVVSRNLNLLIQQLLKLFETALNDFMNSPSKMTLSSETVQSLAEVLALENVSTKMLNDLGKFLYKITELDQSNFDLITKVCETQTRELAQSIREQLTHIVGSFDEMRGRVSPTKVKFRQLEDDGLPNSSPLTLTATRQDSVYEEEKSESMQIDTSTSKPEETKISNILSIKLNEDDERALKELTSDKSKYEMLLRILKLFNLFYENYSTKLETKDSAALAAEEAHLKAMLKRIEGIYGESHLGELVRLVSRVMRILMITSVESQETLSLMLLCVLSQFYPDMVASLNDAKEQEKLEKQRRQQPESGANKDTTKYQIKFMTMEEASKSGGRLLIFKNQNYFTPRIEDITRFCRANKRIINQLIKHKSKNLLTGEIDGIIKNMPDLLDFDNKRLFFKRELHNLRQSNAHMNHHYRNGVQLNIRRDEIFMDAYAQISIRPANEMQGKIHVSYQGERGQDAGGLTRDFFIELSRQMFNPNYSLFVLSSNGSTYYPNPKSSIQADHLRYFKFIGRIVAKALIEECLLECYFVKSFYKIITGEPLLVSDMEDFDNELYNNLKWCVSNDINTLQTTFVAQVDNFGRMQDYELIEGGAKIEVTNDNKNLFIEKMVEFKLYKSIQQQVDAFLEGFYELMPKDIISMFNHKELELLISGLPNFDLADLKKNTEFAGYNASSPQVLWLWEILETFDNEDRAQFLQFVTGSSKVPIDGFKGLIGMRGPQKFTIAKIKSDDILRLPSGHTCFNQIDIPEYPSKEIMHERLLTAIKETRGFGFA